MSYQMQLLIGLAAAVFWAGALVRWLGGEAPLPIVGIAFVVGFAASLIILISGSLYLMGAMTDELWFITGTLGRGIVAGSGFVALLGFRR